MGKSAASNWAGRWARGGMPDPLLGSVPDRSSNRSLMQDHSNCKYCAAGIAENHQPEPIKKSKKSK
jgi:hypothetical protein